MENSLLIYHVFPINPKQVSGSYTLMNNFVSSEIHENVFVYAKIELFINKH